jgi:nicotinamide-nucleotide amidase
MFPDHIIKLATDTLSLARARGMMIATAESCTGGLIAGALTDIAGSSDVVDRGFVTYTNAAKQQVLDVTAASLEKFGAVSETVAKEMAYGALANSMADITVSVTGIAGPGGGSDEKPVGLVWIGICEQGMAPEAFECRFGDIGRSNVRLQTVETALQRIKERLV